MILIYVPMCIPLKGGEMVPCQKGTLPLSVGCIRGTVAYDVEFNLTGSKENIIRWGYEGTVLLIVFLTSIAPVKRNNLPVLLFDHFYNSYKIQIKKGIVNLVLKCLKS